MTKEQHSSGAWYILGAALLWGTTGTAQAFAPAGFDPKVIGALRLLVGGIALLVLSLYRHDLGHLKDWNWKKVFLAAAFTASYQVCFFAAVAKTGVAVGTIVGIGSAPIMSVQLITRIDENQWSEESVFETLVPPLKNVRQPQAFVF